MEIVFNSSCCLTSEELVNDFVDFIFDPLLRLLHNQATAARCMKALLIGPPSWVIQRVIQRISSDFSQAVPTLLDYA
ncbi:hypothetical protein H5410_043175 [Solanum commersonii]|uniref:Uncharacterized protein n=1 Tax=Solanum commersonii TaxID=4109 RepID=A0A9J5XXQ6_SOLCO|nr:hypothetical protein H5410_043175 [Solanum commersonii]